MSNPIHRNDYRARFHKLRESLERMNAFAASLVEQNRALQSKIDRQQVTLASLVKQLEQSSVGVSSTGSTAPTQKSTERQPKESLPTQERLVRASQSQPRETPGNEPVVDPADTPASWSTAENPR